MPEKTHPLIERASKADGAPPPKKQTIAQLAQALAMERVVSLEQKIRGEFVTLKERQAKVRYLHKLLQEINATMSEDEELDWTESEDLRAFVYQAHVWGIEIPKFDTFFPASDVIYSGSEFALLLTNLSERIEELQATGDHKGARELGLFLDELESFSEADKAAFDWDLQEKSPNHPELKSRLIRAQVAGVDVPRYREVFKKTPITFTQDQKRRLVENIKMSTEDFNLQNEMQLQAVNRTTTERYEAYQLARTILRPLHEVKRSIAQKMGSR